MGVLELFCQQCSATYLRSNLSLAFLSSYADCMLIVPKFSFSEIADALRLWYAKVQRKSMYCAIFVYAKLHRQQICVANQLASRLSVPPIGSIS